MKSFGLVLLAALVVVVQGFPPKDNDVATAAAKGDWDEVHRILDRQLMQRHNLRLLTPAELRNLKADLGSHVYGEAVSTFHTSSNVNGHKEEQSGGHRIINDNGKITEYTFKPY